MESHGVHAIRDKHASDIQFLHSRRAVIIAVLRRIIISETYGNFRSIKKIDMVAGQ